jgi:curved DNA-binding protein
LAVDFKDYYKILELSPTATQEEIKRTYKKLARKYHPDVSEEADATAKFQEVSEAYEVLKNEAKRAEYDELREYANNPNQFSGANGQQGRFNSDFSAENGFDDLLRSIFGDQGGFRGTPSGFNARGEDIRYDLAITLEEAHAGGKRSLRLATPSGNKTINVTIPKGVTQGKELRLRGQGEPARVEGRNGEASAGDLYLKISFEKHALFEADGNDITLVLPITPWEAALGTSVEVPTLGGKVNLKIPANSQNGNRLRLKGRGLACTQVKSTFESQGQGQGARAGTGDQFVMLKLVNPPIESDVERAAYETLKSSFNFNPRDTMARQA